jgi:hypothetical protein
MLDVRYCSAICTNWDNKANAIATHRVGKACMNSLFKIFPYYITLQDIHTILQNIA